MSPGQKHFDAMIHDALMCRSSDSLRVVLLRAARPDLLSSQPRARSHAPATKLKLRHKVTRHIPGVDTETPLAAQVVGLLRTSPLTTQGPRELKLSTELASGSSKAPSTPPPFVCQEHQGSPFYAGMSKRFRKEHRIPNTRFRTDS